MVSKKTDTLAFTIIIILFAVSFYLYPRVPEKIPIHWNAAGEIDGYGPRFAGLFLMPIIILSVYLLFVLIPKIAVFKKNIDAFMKYFDGMKIIFLLFFIGMYVATVIQIYRPFNMSYFIAPALGVLFYYIGWVMQFLKRNFFIGIRTPWTLSSDTVWNKTHKLGSILFRVLALFMISVLFFPKYFWLIFVAPLLAAIIYLFVYSYLEFKKEKNKKI